jgi:hypothetical protein
MKKVLTTFLIIIFVLASGIGISTIWYSTSNSYNDDKLPTNTFVNGINCSNLTYEEAADKLTETWNNRSILVTGTLNDELAVFSNYGCTYNIYDVIKTIKQDNKFLAAANYYIKTPLTIETPMVVTDYDPEFKKQVVESDFLNRENATISQDAYVNLEDPEFPIVNEVYGTKSDTEKFFKELINSIELGEIQFVFDERNYYTMPEITADNPDLIAYQQYCQQYLHQKITYEMGESTFTIPASDLDKILDRNNPGHADEVAVSNYVARLAGKYDNVYSERKFKSLTGRTITVAPGTYGWIIDQEGETAQLIKDLNSRKDVSRKPVYSSTGYGEYRQDLGDTYIDVDITRQVVHYFKNGELKFKTPCVTGCKIAGTTTDLGAYYVINKIRDVVLRGDNGDGTEYESPVKYWMGTTWTGEGLHDANWRADDAFGGDIWITNGSHGCINIPPKKMPKLYNMVEIGTPVAVHY